MKKFYLIPIDLDLEKETCSNLTTEQIKDIINEYCEDLCLDRKKVKLIDKILN